jgi:mono/diheme cytochrome c family protein
MKPGAIVIASSLCVCAAIIGCERDDMWEQPKTAVLGTNEFFDDNQGARMPVKGTVARGADNLQEDDLLYRGMENGKLAERFPFEITESDLNAGHDKYDAFCSPCHAKSGDGMGMIVQRGYKQPFSFHIDRLRNAPPGYFYSVLIRGLRPTQLPGVKFERDDDKVHPAVAHKLSPVERWQIIAYIRALQLSQNATIDDVPMDQRGELDKPKTEGGNGESH